MRLFIWPATLILLLSACSVGGGEGPISSNGSHDQNLVYMNQTAAEGTFESGPRVKTSLVGLWVGKLYQGTNTFDFRIDVLSDKASAMAGRSRIASGAYYGVMSFAANPTAVKPGRFDTFDDQSAAG